MKALTVWQPWASLIAAGVKPYEFRGWPAPRALVGRRIAIHAGARAVRRDEIADLVVRLGGARAWETGLRPGAMDLLQRWLSTPAALPRGVVVCTAQLGAAVPADRIAHEFGGAVNDSDRSDHASWAWPLGDITVLEPPVASRGAQGFWEWAP